MAATTTQDEASRVTLEAWLVTDVGVVRDHNEDSAHMEPQKGFFIVADGMGGHAAGEVASAMAVDTVRTTLEKAKAEIDAFKKAPTDAGRRGIVQLLQSAVLSAHQAVYQRGQNEPDKAGMGTTLDVVLVAGPEAFVAHVGDSRTYLIRDGRSSQITTDHTVAEVLVIEGKLTIEEAQVSPLRTILVNAIGVSADVGVEMAHVTLKRGDRLLLCSDGLHDYFPVEEEIAQKLSDEKPGDALKDMVELAKNRGGHDNITGVAVHVTEVVQASPGEIDPESTQPVDANNPFAADEPTETAYVQPPGVPPRMLNITRDADPASIKATQPMRTVGDEMHADTIPPPDNQLPDKRKPGKGENLELAKTDPGLAAVKDEPEPESEAKPTDGVPAPTEIATADTGRIAIAKDKDKDKATENDSAAEPATDKGADADKASKP